MKQILVTHLSETILCLICVCICVSSCNSPLQILVQATIQNIEQNTTVTSQMIAEALGKLLEEDPVTIALPGQTLAVGIVEIISLGHTGE